MSKDSVLIIGSIDDMQEKMENRISELLENDSIGLFLCLNRPYKSVLKNLENKGIKDTKNIFFIDCISESSDENTDNAIVIGNPSELSMILASVEEFLKGMEVEKFLIIDALSTLLIYNTEKEVTDFVKSLIEITTYHNSHDVIYTPKARIEHLFDNIKNLFDEVDFKKSIR